ncbi:NAD(P) transhydrogenase subunit alpha [Murinocardiopsis flavida]|uniref:proton-translocating NAD(P)(+) transhydrogenase n=1 Tax=Murinocardiopsis flavida TaxID=645275 RepID=A0A2P8D8R8_9ACTN|nr:NAD(P) transhydrogenase subunit alpha [Murinocardiopsis flavida]PSK93615.1 NAD(P) transhydrogenase subunit alpha [Murinocardiopsis flavida]
MSERPLNVGVVNEVGADELRVALNPEMVARLTQSGLELLVETGAGDGARYSDGDYRAAGAAVVARDELTARADLLVSVGRLPPDLLRELGGGRAVAGLLNALSDPPLIRDLAAAGVTVISLDCLPRTLSRAQPMDALSSQASVAGYKAVLVAANAYDRYFPLLMTAAGTAPPAEVLVLGAGIAGLQAIATARRLGAVVTGYDVRPQAAEEVRSLGARFLELDTGPSDAEAGDGGYARELTPERQREQRDELARRLPGFDVVITTAQVPGRRPPVLITAESLAKLAPGAVVVDMAAGPLGGNVESSVPGETVVTEAGVKVIGAGNLAAAVPRAASDAYARTMHALITLLVRDGALAVDLDDDVQAGVVITHGGAVTHPAAHDAVEALDHAESGRP